MTIFEFRSFQKQSFLKLPDGSQQDALDFYFFGVEVDADRRVVLVGTDQLDFAGAVDFQALDHPLAVAFEFDDNDVIF